MKYVSFLRIILFTFAISQLSAQRISYEIIPLDSLRTKWAYQVISVDKENTLSVNRSAPTDSATAVKNYTALIDGRSEQYAKEISFLKDGFKSINTTYDEVKKSLLGGSLVGTWDIIKTDGSKTNPDNDTMTISINKSLKVSGGAIKGEIIILDKDKILLNKVVPLYPSLSLFRKSDSIYESESKPKYILVKNS